MINLNCAKILNLEPEMNYDAVLPKEIFYDRQIKRYRFNNTGVFVSRNDVIALQKKYLSEVTRQFTTLAPRIILGEIGLAKEAAELLKKIHLSQAIIAANGIDKLSSSDLGFIGNILKKQYHAGVDPVTGRQFGLKHLFREVQGKPGYSEARLKARLEMYALSGEISGNLVKENHAKASGLTEAKRVLGKAEHCSDCIRYAGSGWQPIGQLPYPKTQCQCLTRCRCSIIYR